MAQRPTNNNNSDNSENSNITPSESNIPAYLKAALRISTSYPLGAPSSDTAIADGAINLRPFRPVPGYMVLDYVPTVGVSTDSTSAVNRAAFNEFNAIRSQISGNRSYEPADHMIYRHCVDGMRDLYHYVRRIYGIVRKYSATNLYRPMAALECMGLDAQNWFNNAADLYQWLLIHKDSLAPFPTVPIGNISARHEIYNTYMFTDGAIDSVQTYVLNQRAFWSYEVVDEVRGITTRQFPRTFAAFCDMWDEMYAALQGSYDVYQIAADIRRAFPDKYTNGLPDTPVDYVVEYKEFDPIKCALMNAMILGTDTSSGNLQNLLNAFRIRDEEGIIMCDPVFRNALGSFNPGNIIETTVMLNHINSISDTPDDGILLNSMRLKPVIRTSLVEGGLRETRIISMGTEIIISASLCGFDGQDGIDTIHFSTCVAVVLQEAGTNGNGTLNNMYANIAGMISNFDWHPPVIVTGIGDETGDGSYTALIEDVQNYIPISDTTLSSVHDANLLAEFGV